ncbi:hypothetical protein PRZ48_000166 [Zasmidium cellare]|uniref:NACHT domain-containing protein n=1 Tax=Zasmidium cellare TaxID=395010 RepID=A0ABR0EXQ5_ZASCE|nr:hypothetical protein PRZ48_000166 [Zasmidium cellare]
MAEDSKSKRSWLRQKFRHESPSRQTASIQQATAPKQSSSSAAATDLVVTTNLKNTADTTKLANNYSTDKVLLWREAYKALKDDAETQGMVMQYESFLRDPANGLVKAASELDGRPEPEQMDLLLDRSLEKTARMDKVDRRLAFAIDIVLSVKEIVGTAVSSVPIAAAAWTPICIALEFLVKSPKENQENLDGVVEVVKKMKWYSNLSLLLLAETLRVQDERYIDLRSQLADRIRDLYKAILDYIIKTICVHHQNVLTRFASNIFRSWQDKLDAILKAEKMVTDFASQQCNQQMNTQLELLLDFHLTKEESAVTSKLSDRNMYDEMTALEKRKDKLIPNSYSWISAKPEYKQVMAWDTQTKSRLLWIKGAAGTGKTMIMIGLIRELHEHFNLPCLCYFLCQGTNDELNTATAILKGLMAMLVRQNKALFQHVLKEVKASGDRFLTASDAFPTLKRIFLDMVQDQALERAVLVVDALDECKHAYSHDPQAGLVDLLDLITATIQTNKVKWLVSARNVEQVAHAFANRSDDSHQANTSYESIEVNKDSVADAVDLFINRKVDELKQKHVRKVEGKVPKSTQRKLEEQEKALNDVGERLRDRTDGTFLWVSLVFRELKDCDPRNMLEQLEKIPSDLKRLYARMIQRIAMSPHRESYQRAISAAVLAYRPLGVAEMMMLANLPGGPGGDENFLKNSGLLTARDGVVNLLHQSTLEYLKERPDDDIRKLFPDGHVNGHAGMIRHSLEAMKDDLVEEDIRLRDPATPREELSDLAYLVAVRYSCRYWIDHFCDMPKTAREKYLCDKTLAFLKFHLLDWLVAVCLMQELPSTMLSVRRVQKLLQHEQPQSELLRLVGDVDRFCRLVQDGIQEYPLQVYCTLIFTPAHSMIRDLFQSQKPDFIANVPIMEDDWDACQQTFMVKNSDHGRFLGTEKFAAASGSEVQFLDLQTGSRSQWSEQTFEASRSIVFSPDGRLLASVKPEGVEIWSFTERKKLSEIDVVVAGHGSCSITFSPSRPEVALGAGQAEASPTVSIYDLDGTSLAVPILQVTLDGHLPARFNGLAYSPDGSLLATVGGCVQVWDVQTGKCKSTVNERPTSDPPDLSDDGKRLVMVKDEGASISVWNIETPSASLVRRFTPPDGETTWPDGHLFWYCGIFLKSSELVAAACSDDSIRLLNVFNGDRFATLSGHSLEVESLSCSTDGTTLASLSVDGTVKLWTITSNKNEKDRSHRSSVKGVSISADSSWFASASAESVRVWDVEDSRVRTLAGETSVRKIAISPDSDMLATVQKNVSYETTHYKTDDTDGSVEQGKGFTVWKKDDYSCTRVYDSDFIEDIQFSPCGTMVAAATTHTTKLWSLADPNSGPRWSIERGPDPLENLEPVLAFSPHENLIAFHDYRSGHYIKIFDLTDGQGKALVPMNDLGESDTGPTFISLAFSQDGAKLLCSNLAGRVQVWNTQTTRLLHDFHASKYLTYLSFIDNGPRIRTNQGVFLLPPVESTPGGLPPESVAVRFQGPGVEVRREWITWDGLKLLWLPPSYRPTASDVRDRTVVVGCGSGQVYVVAFEEDFDGFERPAGSETGSAVVV